MKTQETVRVFIGSGEASLLERKTLIYSLRQHTQRDLDIYVFNGTHNAIELNDGDPYLAPLPLHLKYKNRITEFSLYRFLIPQLCGYQGRAIYVDSDMVCLQDIGQLFDTPMVDADGNDCAFLAKAEAYPEDGQESWGLSVMLFDCAHCRFDLEVIFQEIEQGLYSYFDFTRMSPQFLTHHPHQIGPIDPQWNSFDYWDDQTKLIHYTELDTQPWKYPNHPYGELWFRYFREAMAAGYVSDEDVSLSMRRAYVRRDLMYGNSFPQIWMGRTKRWLGTQARSLKKRVALSL